MDRPSSVSAGFGGRVSVRCPESPWRLAWRPRYWPTALGLGGLRLMILLPISWQQAVGRRLGRWLGKFARRRTRIGAVNLALCFPELSDAERGKLLRGQLESVGIALFETALAWWGSERRLARISEVVGLEHLHRAQSSGRGILFLTGHFTLLELGARLLTPYHRFHAMYRPQPNALFEAVMEQVRRRHSGLPTITQNDIRTTVRVLKRGGAVWYAPDHDYGRQSVFAPFFGVPALTITATSRLARMSNALVLPYYPQRLPDGRYRVTVLPPLEDFPGADAVADATRINTVLEDCIRRVPEQYLWLHRRFKHRPPGEPYPY